MEPIRNSLDQRFLHTQNLLPEQGIVQLYRDFLDSTESGILLKALSANVAWKTHSIQIFGKTVSIPRLTAYYGDEGAVYTYSGVSNHPLPWLPALRQLKLKIAQYTGVSFNSVLLNLYRSGSDSMGWHRDNEPELGTNPVIASVSLGSERLFKMRPYREKIPVVPIVLTSGSLLYMSGETQHYWEHAVPKTSVSMEPRINLTFRNIKV